MADQTNSLTAILAALAAQRPGSTPTQSQPPSYPPQAAPLPPQQPVYGGAPGGYPLPQPSSSGNVDLSAIKPVSSGSVRLEDAVARAKAIAAEKGISYDRPASHGLPDMRSDSARPYAQPRSRSRSPGRREPTYRNAYGGAYDRRDGPSGRDYGRDRERSFSPGDRHGPSGTFSPRGAGSYGRERSPVGRGGDDGSETIQVESHLVGLIIGRSGENLRRVEKDTGCRVQFQNGPGENGPIRTCKITGPRARRAEAKAEINRIVEENGMGVGQDRGKPEAHSGAEENLQIMVPDRTVGLIIGRGGETIRDLQERSGCHINIVGESKSVNGLRPVNLIGNHEAAVRAKDLIMEIVESDSKNGTTKDRPQQFGYAGGNTSDHGKVNDSIFVPSDAVGMIIGKGGETIREMQNTTGCKINVTPSSGPGEVEREIGLIGTRDAIEQAKVAIMDKVDAVSGGPGSGPGRSRPPPDHRDRNYNQPSYGAATSQTPAATTAAAPTGGEDPYAAYGGYQAYVALWYQAMAAQQAGQAPGDPSQPPGTA